MKQETIGDLAECDSCSLPPSKCANSNRLCTATMLAFDRYRGLYRLVRDDYVESGYTTINMDPEEFEYWLHGGKYGKYWWGKTSLDVFLAVANSYIDSQNDFDKEWLDVWPNKKGYEHIPNTIHRFVNQRAWELAAKHLC